MKASWEWTELDILALIADAVVANVNLEYKRCDSLQRLDANKKEISKDVSSFANSAGGTIVYGLKENGHIPTGIDVGFDPRGDISKEWLENVITSTIQPRVDGLRITPVLLDSTQPGRVLYVVHIPQSKRPHMANDHRFYKRFNFKSQPMDEYEVMDVMRRNEAPDLRLSFHLQSSEGEEVPHGEYLNVDTSNWMVKIDTPIRNDSEEVALYADVRMFLDPRLNLRQAFPTDAESTEMFDGTQMTRIYIPWSVPSRMPIWNGSEFKVGLISLVIPKMEGTYNLGWQIRSPKMKLKHGKQYLRCNGVEVAILDRDPTAV